MRKRYIEKITVILGMLTLLFFLLDAYLPWGGWFSLFITAATTFYHFAVRLLVGVVTRICLRKRILIENPWFTSHSWEKPFYETLGVKKWKNKMPTYIPMDFSLKAHTPTEVIQNMCIAEVGHEINVICSFLPLFYALFQPRLRQDWIIFAVTGILALGAEVPFILMQRYNRPRMIALQGAWERRRENREEEKHAVEL